MTNSEDGGKQQSHVGSAPTAPPTADLENPTTEETASIGVAGILRRWKREDLLRRGSLALRGLAFLFSLLSFIIMASNKHGDWKNFDRYEEFRYVLAIATLSTLYSGGQCLLKVHELSTGKYLFQRSTSALFDFCGDQYHKQGWRGHRGVIESYWL
ncbi:CASP-like protein 4B1 isoform X2 [Morus notabilis]|uniref:CASP-like protein 4B1 isoform X2 n=1 Tax=Morus notabilis TaxID=981085 RepID=UPI000CED5D34|nr:CASP-like protein 4B1 isoform X2 [Morus notabilis]